MGAILRPATQRDAEGIARIYAPIVSETAISFETEPPSPDEMRRRIEADGARTPWLVCADGELVWGYACATGHRTRAAYRWSTEVSAYVDAAQRQRGIGAGLYRALLAILTLQGFHRGHAGITLPNDASVALHERVGFTPIGIYREVGYKFGLWHDVGWWGRTLARPGDPPAEPVAFAEIRSRPEVVAALDDETSLLPS